MSRTPEREALYRWIGPLVTNEWALFAPAGATPPATMDDTLKARIGSYQGDAIVTWLQTRGYTVDIAPSDDDNPRKLKVGRIDYWATGRLTGQYRLKQLGLDAAIVPVLTFNRTDMYLACQRKLPEDLAGRMNAELVAMAKRGSVGRIFESYGFKPPGATFMPVPDTAATPPK
jgi:polar amino acid transport system substrate-binding protein